MAARYPLRGKFAPERPILGLKLPWLKVFSLVRRAEAFHIFAGK